MIVVSNTSPLTNLAAIGQFDLLRRLYGRIQIPNGVWRELNAGATACPGRDEVACATWVERRSVRNVSLVTALQDLTPIPFNGLAKKEASDQDRFAKITT